MEQRKKALISELRRMGIGETVLDAIEKTERHLFIPQGLIHCSYDNNAQPIGHGQTISQPFTVASMIELLEIEAGNKILEIGAGSGYNAAVMSHLVGPEGKIISVEIVPELVDMAKSNLSNAGITNVKVVYRNGYQGYEEEAPYDRIIVTAAADTVPDILMDQLTPGGIMVIPITETYCEVMTKVVKKEKPVITKHGAFRFVPFKKT